MIPLISLLMLVVVNFLGGACTTNTSAASTIPTTDFEHFNVRETIAGIKTKSLEVQKYKELSAHNEDAKGEGKWRMELVHRDVVSSANSTTHRHAFNERVKRDIRRVASLTRRLSGGDFSYKVEEFGSDVVSGMDQGSGEYFVRIGVGSPPRDQYMVIDTGSDMIWVQCQPCKQCYWQSDPIFDPAYSASFAGVSCSSAICRRLENAHCRRGQCHYQVSYSDGSYTKGTLALETLTFGQTVVQNVAIGCGHRNHGMFVGAAGLLGLGGGSVSFLGQLGDQNGGAFSYCLASSGTGTTGSLIFGNDSIPVGATRVPLLCSPQAPSFYYVGLLGLGVGGIRVPVPEEIFRLSEVGNGGVVMDTGTAVTRLPKVAYEIFRDSFIAGIAGLPRTTGVSIFDTCYDLFGFEMVRVPTVSFYFSGGPILTLPARNFLIPVDEMGTFCFAFAPSSGVSIIGNIQQEGIQVSFDVANGFVGFGPNAC